MICTRSAEEQAASQTSAGNSFVATTNRHLLKKSITSNRSKSAVASEKVEVAKEATVAEKTTNATEAALVEKQKSERGSYCSRNKTEVAENLRKSSRSGYCDKF